MIISKPIARQDRNGRWSVRGCGKEGNGATLRGAYMDWLNECQFYPYV